MIVSHIIRDDSKGQNVLEKYGRVQWDFERNRLRPVFFGNILRNTLRSTCMPGRATKEMKIESWLGVLQDLRTCTCSPSSQQKTVHVQLW